MARPLPVDYYQKEEEERRAERRRHAIGKKCATCGAQHYDDGEWMEVTWHDGEMEWSGTYCDIECLTGEHYE